MATNKERLIANNDKIEEIKQTLAKKQVSPTDMLQARVDSNNSCYYLFYSYDGESLDFAKGLDTSNVTTMNDMFNNCYVITSLDLSWLKTDNVAHIQRMFKSCGKLTKLDLSHLNLSLVRYTNSMFESCSVLEEIILPQQTTKIKPVGMSSMFTYCYKLKKIDISMFDFSEATDINKMFNQCGELTQITFPTEKVELKAKDMTNMFYGCKKLASVDLSSLDTKNVTSMDNMFSNCQLLEIAPFMNTYNVTDMAYLFRYCYVLKTIPQYDTSNVRDMQGMFYECRALEEVPLLDTSKVTNMGGMFQLCSNLTTVHGLDLLGVTSTNVMFKACHNLTNLTLKNIKISLAIGSGTSYGTLLTNESLINTFKELWDLTGSSSQTLTLSTTSKNNIANIYVKLVDVTDDMLAQDEYAENKKPCVVCEPTDEGAMTLTEYAISKNWQIA